MHWVSLEACLYNGKRGKQPTSKDIVNIVSLEIEDKLIPIEVTAVYLMIYKKKYLQ